MNPQLLRPGKGLEAHYPLRQWSSEVPIETASESPFGTFQGLVRQIYSAPLEQDGWTHLTRELREQLGCAQVFLLSWSPHEPAGCTCLGTQVPSDIPLNLSRGEQYLCELRRGQPDSLTPGNVAIYSRRFSEPLDDRHGQPTSALPTESLLLEGRIANDCSRTTSLLLTRTARQTAWQIEEITLIESLLPHLATALQMTGVLEAQRASLRSLTHALDWVRLGILLLNHRGEVVFLNREARRILNANTGLKVTTRGLRSTHPAESAHLQALISSVLRKKKTPAGDVLDGGLLCLTQPGRRPPLEALVMPLPKAAQARRVAVSSSTPATGPSEVPGGAVALVLVSDPGEHLADGLVQLIESLYQLTPAQARLAHHLLRGLRLQEAAQQEDIQISTARSHLRALFAKTNTCRQAELLRRLLQGLSQILSPPGHVALSG